jgi:hypothetical protein
MTRTFTETEYSQLVDRYKKLRTVNRNIHNALLSYLPKKVLKKCAQKLGISKSGTFIFQEEHETDVLIDYCIYDYHEDSENAVSRYLKENPPTPGSDEHVVLKAMLESYHSLIQVEGIVERVGIRAHDLLSNRRILLVDIGLSQTTEEGIVIAARIIPFEDFVMTSGAALPVDADTLIQIMDLLTEQFNGGPEKFRDFNMEQKANLTTSIINLCLDANASSRIAYKDIQEEPQFIPFPIINSRIGRNDPCPCGTGKKYKRCCGR